jgi:hypothetical protein
MKKDGPFMRTIFFVYYPIMYKSNMDVVSFIYIAITAWTRFGLLIRERIVIMYMRIFFFLIGYFMALSGGITTIAYLNLLTIGYGFTEYLRIISQQPACFLFPAGVIILTISIFFPNSSNKL